MSLDCPDALLDTMLLIQSVKSRPCLYERDHLRYGDVNYKRVEWEETTKILFADVWEKYNDEEKAEKVDLVLKRWKNLRACFAREVKRQKEPKWIYGVSYKRRPYLYYNDLLFLKPECDNADEDVTHDIDLPENNEADNTTVTVDTNIEEISIPEARPVPKSKTDTNRTIPATYSDKTKSLSNTNNTKTLPNSNNSESTSNLDTTINANDLDSTHFALSLVPLLNLIPIKERIDAEIKILSVLQPFLKRCREDNRKPGRDNKKRKVVLSGQTYEIKSEASSNDDHDL